VSGTVGGGGFAVAVGPVVGLGRAGGDDDGGAAAVVEAPAVGDSETPDVDGMSESLFAGDPSPPHPATRARARARE
jgi:hypothetical protein